MALSKDRENNFRDCFVDKHIDFKRIEHVDPDNIEDFDDLI